MLNYRLYCRDFYRKRPRLRQAYSFPVLYSWLHWNKWDWFLNLSRLVLDLISWNQGWAVEESYYALWERWFHIINYRSELYLPFDAWLLSHILTLSVLHNDPLSSFVWVKSYNTHIKSHYYSLQIAYRKPDFPLAQQNHWWHSHK